MRSAKFRDRLRQRAERAKVTLAEESADRLETYYLLLSHWNRKINLTALPLESMADHAIDRVIVEPLVAAGEIGAGLLPWFDLGSGGGSPAIPIKILRPEAHLTMVEARSRKAAFLREAIRELSLSNVAVIEDRIENLEMRVELAGVAQVVTVRAVRADAVFFGSARFLLGGGGELFIFTSTHPRIPRDPRFVFSRAVGLLSDGESSQLVVLVAR